MSELSQQTTRHIVQDFELADPGGEAAPSEAELYQLLCDRISWLIEHNMEYLLSLLYRNDVAERKIHDALSPLCPDPANQALAKLVMERQKQRMETKKQYGSQPSDGVDEELKW
ncbi:MAG: hypothetical protein R2830_10890 [Saprospiraceae bacterium]